MKHPLIFILSLFLAGFASAQTKADIDYINGTLVPATVLLYSQTEAGTMKMRCTGTAIEKTTKGYIFATAAHCACIDNTDKQTVSPEQAEFYITSDTRDEKTFLKVTPVACGYRHKGDDFALFESDSKSDFQTVALGKDPTVLESVVNVASPLGLGKQVFMGAVSSPSVDRPIVMDDINWTNAVLLQLFGVDHGSSGSAVVCLDQHAICAFVVGSMQSTTMVGMPVSRLIAMRQKIKEGKYPAWKPEPVAAEDAKGTSVMFVPQPWGTVYVPPVDHTYRNVTFAFVAGLLFAGTLGAIAIYRKENYETLQSDSDSDSN